MRKILFLLLAPASLLFWPTSTSAQQKAQITGMQNTDFGLVGNLQVDATRSTNLCVYSSSPTYSVTAFGSAAGGDFALSGAAGSLPFEVQWAQTSGSSTGTKLQPNQPLTSQISVATHKTCNNGPLYSASLIVKLRAGDLGTARAGSYSGALSIIVAAE